MVLGGIGLFAATSLFYSELGFWAPGIACVFILRFIGIYFHSEGVLHALYISFGFVLTLLLSFSLGPACADDIQHDVIVVHFLSYFIINWIVDSAYLVTNLQCY